MPLFLPGGHTPQRSGLALAKRHFSFRLAKPACMRRRSGVPTPLLHHEDVPALLRTAGLTKRYGRYTVLDRVSFFAIPGEILGLIGPNGSGKTTLLETVAGLLP